jgi:hypothetical protein
MKSKVTFPLGGIVLAVLCHPVGTVAAEPMALDLQQRGFFHGREYFVVRSGRLQWLIQADRADLGPAVTGYLFDATHIAQNKKQQAYSFDETHGVRSSALEVVSQQSGFAFAAFGEQMRVRWALDSSETGAIEKGGPRTPLRGPAVRGAPGPPSDHPLSPESADRNIPAVEATWWADGVHVTERFSGLADNNTIRRTISLTGAHLHGDEQYSLRLRLPAGNAVATNRALFVTHRGCPQALVVAGSEPVTMDPVNGIVEIGPVTLSPDQTVTIETYLLAQIPANTQTAEDFQKQIARVANEAGPLLDATRARWAQASRVETDDSLVQEVFDITRSVLPAIAADDGTVRVGPFQYAAEWVRDDSQFSLGLTAAGHFELARSVLEHCIRDMLTAEGTTMIGGGFDKPDREQFDQTGELMLALRWYADFSGDTSLVETYRAKLIALVERPLNPSFRDATGLVHNRREFWEQTMNDAYELAYNTYVVVGLREAAALAAPLGAQDRRESWLKEAAAIQEAMLKTLVQDGALIKRRNVTGEVAERLVQLAGAPDTPCRSAEHHVIYPDATMALPIALGLVEPGSALASNTLNQVEKLRNQRWWGGGYGRYDASAEINMPGPWGIAGALVLRGQHAGGMLDRSRSTLEWFRTVQGGNGGLYYEEIPLLAGSQQNWLGLVTWPTGELPYFVVRHYLGLTFEDGCVVIRPQLYPNSPPVHADLRFRQGRLRMAVDGAGEIAEAALDGKAIDVAADGAVRLPREFSGGSLVLRARK